MVEKVIIAGFGGQGILFLGRLLAQAAMHEGKNVTFFPSYGPEVRGGRANCAVIISSGEIFSPMVTQPDTLLAISPPLSVLLYGGPLCRLAAAPGRYPALPRPFCQRPGQLRIRFCDLRQIHILILRIIR